MKTAVKIGVSRQVAIPKKIYDDLGLSPGDYMEISVEENQLVMTPKTLLDKRLAQSLEDFRQGRYYGPFTSAKEMMRDFRKRHKIK